MQSEQLDEVGARHHPFHAALGVGHHEPLDAILVHQLYGALQSIVLADRERVGRHDVVDDGPHLLARAPLADDRFEEFLHGGTRLDVQRGQEI